VKRYRVLGHDFDSRAATLTMEIKEGWEDNVKKSHRDNKEKVKRGLLLEYGFVDADTKLQNFIDLGPKPFSVVAYHNRFAEQVRRSFIVGGYYPALTGACALGERILNHLLLALREDFKHTPEYKKVHGKSSFDNWDLAIRTLEAWKVLQPKAVESFRKLANLRSQRAIHFDPATDRDDRPLALEAIRYLTSIIYEQFGSFGPHPWFITSIPGETYLKKEAEDNPFINKIYLPNCSLVGPQHTLEYEDGQWLVLDEYEYGEREVSDDEFSNLRLSASGL
jgi:hypothetical protein